MVRALVCLIIGATVGFSAVSPLQAQSELREALVSERCDLVKNKLDAQRRRDLVSRINRGYAYQNIAHQLQALTSRVRNNGLNYAPFEAHQDQLENAFSQFRANYSEYDDVMSHLLSINCKEKPAEFLQQLDTARQLRQKLGTDVQIMQGILNAQRQIISDLVAELERIQNAVLGERR